MYLVTGDSVTRLIGGRREAFRTARQIARRAGSARLWDALGGEGVFHFDHDPATDRLMVCTCADEARLLRAIFNEPHPERCL